MRLEFRILCLPVSILALIASHAVAATGSPDDESSPALSPLQERDAGDHSLLRRRAVEEHLRLGRNPVGVMKMGTDEGEKFYMEYWQFDPELERTGLFGTTSLRSRDENEEALLLANASATIPYRAPFALHTEDGPEISSFEDLKARSFLEGRGSSAMIAPLAKRQFACPNGTYDCGAIGYANSCCGMDETCFPVQDTGLGHVGCCLNGTHCVGTITSCNAPNTPCADTMGGGCCIPNYICQGVGCVIDPTLVVTTVITRTFTVSGLSTQVTSVVTTIKTSTSSISSPPPSSPTPVSTSSTTSSQPVSSSAAGVAPVRPTGTSITTPPGTVCPTGFYACSAYYDGGCCQIGRDCQKTSCPTSSSTTIISDGLTVVVPVGPAATVTTPTGTCAAGWATCAASIGGNCCPSGWECGTASCSSVAATGTDVAQKESPNGGLRNRAFGVSGIAIPALIMGFLLM